MKIGHFMSGIWDQGGIGSYLRRVGHAQREAGHSVRFLDNLDRYATAGDAEDRPIVVPEGELATLGRDLKLDVLHLHAGLGRMPVGGPPVVRTLHGHQAYCPSGERYLKRSGLPCDRAYSLSGCLWGHLVDRCGSVRPARLAANFATTRRERSLLPGTAMIAISRFAREQMVRSGYDAESIHVVHNPSPPVRSCPPPPKDGVPRFLFIGRLVSYKGLDWALRAIARLGRPLALDVAGDGPQRAEYESLTADLGLSESVKFHGWLDEAGLDRLAASARAVVFPSIWHEPAGLACLDGSARGRAVIGSRTGGLPEYAVDGENALIVAPNDEPGLADALARLADDWYLAVRLGETGRAMAAGPFAMEHHLGELDRIYRDLAR